MSLLNFVLSIIIKPLYYLFSRSAVQIQILVIIAAFLVAWFFSRQIVELLHRIFPDEFKLRLKEIIIEQEYAPENEQAGERTDYQGEPPAEEKLSRRQKIKIYFQAIIPQSFFPMVWLGAMLAARTFMAANGYIVGLIDQVVLFALFFVGYRLIVGIIRAGADEKVAHHYQYLLLAPLFFLFAAYYAVGWFVNPNVIGNTVVLEMFGNAITWQALFMSTVGLYLWVQITWAIQNLLYYFLTRRTDANHGAIEASLTLMRYILIVVGVLYVFSNLNFSPAALAAVTAGVSAGIAFGSREILNNFIGGILLLFEQSVRPGDTIEIDGERGVVQTVSIRSTLVQAYDGREIIVPNSKILTSSMITYTKSSRHSRIKMDIGVGYNADLKLVLEILRNVPEAHSNVLADPAPNAFLVGFGASSVDFVLFAWVSDLVDKFSTTHELYFMVWDAFAENGIEIPYPQRDLHLRSVPRKAIDEQEFGAGSLGVVQGE